jgi:hypothetical protein
MTFDDQLTWLRSRGFIVGPRDSERAPNQSGLFMCAESDGPWVETGNDLEALVESAYRFWAMEF